MSTITLPNIRVGSDLQVRVRLKDGGVAIDWSTLSNVKACIYSDAQRALAGRCGLSIDEEDNTLLVCTYAANKPQYLGVNRIVVSAKYMGETKTYDKPAFSFVRWTADQEGEQITIDDPDVDVEISVEDVSSSILQEAVDAAFSAADRANEAAAAAEHMVDIHTGPEGKSAYEVAVDEGFVGTEEEWLASLVGPQGVQGVQGETGEAAGFGSVSAALQEDGGDPSVVVAASGEDTSKNFAFTFKNLKGDKGDKGDQGNTGSSVDYPYELVNNLTTNDATKGLTAAMGVTLEGEVSQLEAKVGELPPETKPIVVGNWTSGTYVTTNQVGVYSADNKRIICDIDLNRKEGNLFSVIMSNGSQVSIRFVSVSQFANPTDIAGIDANEILLATGWTGTNTFTIPVGTKSAIIVMKNAGNTTIDTSASSDASFAITSAPSFSEKMEELSDELDEINAPSTILFDIENWVNGTYVTTNNLGVYSASTTRIIGTVAISGMDGELFAVTTASGYDASIRFLSVPQFADPTQISGVTQEQLLLSTGWINTSNVTIPSGTRSAVIVLRKHDDSTVDTTIASNASFSVTLDGLKSRVDALEAEITGARKEITGYYSGERLYLGTKTKLPFLRKDWKTIGIPSYAQALAIYGDYIVFFYGTANATGSLWSISNGTKICDLTFSYGALGRPHGNVICFGTEFAEGNTELPLLYVSQWDNEGGCLVYNISTDGDTWSCELVQTIMVDNMDEDIYGSALGDWVVDKDANAIYSVKYRIASSSTLTGNALHFCKFTLPKLSDGPSVVFTDTDVIDSFITGMVQTTQDKKIHEGVLFFSAGNTSNNKQKICAVSLTRKSIISEINLEGYGNEPEGIDIIDEGLVLGYGYSPTKFYLISDVL